MAILLDSICNLHLLLQGLLYIPGLGLDIDITSCSRLYQGSLLDLFLTIVRLRRPFALQCILQLCFLEVLRMLMLLLHFLS